MMVTYLILAAIAVCIVANTEGELSHTATCCVVLFLLPLLFMAAILLGCTVLVLALLKLMYNQE